MSVPVPFFQGVSPFHVGEARRWLHRHAAKAGEVVMEEGDPTPALAYVASGRVEVVMNGVPIDESGPGEVVGEGSLFTGQPRTATVRMLDDGELWVLDADGYATLRNAGNEAIAQLERLVLDLQGKRLRRLDGMVVERATPVPSPWTKPPPTVFARLRELVGGKEKAPPVVPKKLDAAMLLAVSALFRGEPGHVTANIAGALTQRTFARGDLLCTQGESGDAMFFLGEGSVDVFVVPENMDPSRIVPLATLLPGDAVGLTALVDDRPRVASVVAREQVDVLVLDRERWKRFLRDDTRAGSAMRAAVIRAFASQLAGAGASFVGGATAGLEALEARARLELTKG